MNLKNSDKLLLLIKHNPNREIAQTKTKQQSPLTSNQSKQSTPFIQIQS